jgi:tetratricopeptide (TPR) repeat protein
LLGPNTGGQQFRFLPENYLSHAKLLIAARPAARFKPMLIKLVPVIASTAVMDGDRRIEAGGGHSESSGKSVRNRMTASYPHALRSRIVCKRRRAQRPRQHTAARDVLKAQGHLDDALASYRNSLAISKALLQRDSGNTDWQKDLSMVDDKVGDVLKAQGHLDEALAAYRDGLPIAKAVAQKDPGNAIWQRDLAVMDNDIGDVSKEQGHLDEALAAYRDALAVRNALSQKDPSNTMWQLELSINDN